MFSFRSCRLVGTCRYSLFFVFTKISPSRRRLWIHNRVFNKDDPGFWVLSAIASRCGEGSWAREGRKGSADDALVVV